MVEVSADDRDASPATSGRIRSLVRSRVSGLWDGGAPGLLHQLWVFRENLHAGASTAAAAANLARGLLARGGMLGLGDKRWVFVLGCYNSGTTLLKKVLGSHPAVGSMPIPVDGDRVTDVLTTDLEHGLPRQWALRPELFRLGEDSLSRAAATRLRRQWAVMMDDLSRPYLLEKSILDAARVRWLDAHFDPAYFVAVVRNGYAVAEGIRRKAGIDVERAAAQWAESNRIMLEDLDAVERKLVLTYEELTTDTEGALRRIVDFLGAPPFTTDPAGTRWRVHGVTSPIVNMNDRSLGALGAEDVSAIRDVAGSALDRFGYGPPD